MAQIVTITNPLTGQPAQVDQLEHTAQEIDDAIARAIPSTDHPGCYYRMIDGVTEWVNPPMQLGVEYRTTERYQGKPVYVKTVSTGAMPAGAGISNRVIVYPSIPPSDVDSFIHFEGLVTNGTMSYTLPVGYGNTRTEPDITGYLYKYSNTYVVICQSSYDMSEYSGTLTLWYTKTTD